MKDCGGEKMREIEAEKEEGRAERYQAPLPRVSHMSREFLIKLKLLIDSL